MDRLADTLPFLLHRSFMAASKVLGEETGGGAAAESGEISGAK